MRRGFLYFLLFSSYFLGIAQVIDSTLVGIDFGTEYIKASIAKPLKGLDIVLNRESRRKTYHALAFYDGERLFSDDAVNIMVRKPELAFVYSTQFLGDDLDAAKDFVKMMGLPYKVAATDRGTLKISYKSDSGEEEWLSAEEVTAQILSNMIDISSNFAEDTIRDVVITVPGFWGPAKRQALLDAASIAGVNVLSLMNDYTAFALKYGIDHKFDGEKPHSLLIYDMGSSHTTAALVSFIAKDSEKGSDTLEIKAVAHDETLGGLAFDARIADYLAQEFNKNWNGDDVRNYPRAMAKIRKQASRVKEVLSANTETLVGVESVIDDLDLRVTLTRSIFEEICADLFERAAAPVHEVLTTAGVTVEDIDSATIVGGSSRIPKVQAALSEALQDRALDKNLNGDEAGALGSAFYGATLSSAFKTRKITIYDLSTDGYGVEVSRGASSTSSKPPPRSVVFPAHNRFPAKKQLSFNRKEDFDVSVFYTNSASDASDVQFEEKIGDYHLVGVDRALEFNATATPKVSVTFALTKNGMASLERAEATVDEVVLVETTRRKSSAKGSEDAKADEGDEGTSDGDEADDAAAGDAEAQDVDDAGDAGGDDSAPSDDGNDIDSADGDVDVEVDDGSNPDEEEDGLEKIYTEKTYVRRVALDVVWEPAGTPAMNEADIASGKSTLAMLKRRDEEKKERADAVNALETFLYSTRDTLEEEGIVGVTTEEQRQELSDMAMAAEDWMFEDGWDAPASEYKSKHGALVALLDAMLLRKAEMIERPKSVEWATGVIDTTREILAAWNETSAPQILESEKEEVYNMTVKAEKWLEEKLAEQEGLAVHESPAFLSKDVLGVVRPMQDRVMALSRRPKPPPKRKNKLFDKSDVMTEDDEAAEAAAAANDADAGEPADDGTEQPEVFAGGAEAGDGEEKLHDEL